MTRKEFTEKDDDLLAKYIAKYNPREEGRQGNALYMRLCENADGNWPFSKRHPWQSWRNRYRSQKTEIDRKISRYIKRPASEAPRPTQGSAAPSSPRREASARVPFSLEDDQNLVEYMATHASRSGLQGQKYWIELLDQAEALPWLKRHTWQSWRERYKNNIDYFKQAVRRHTAGDAFDEPAILRPKTVEDYRVKKPPMSSRFDASPPRKRLRASEPGTDEQPAKKARVAQDQGTAERLSSKRNSIELPRTDVVDEDQGVPHSAEGPDQDPVETAEEDCHGIDEEYEGVGDEDNAEGEGEALSPSGSEDYRNEIFSEPEEVPGVANDSDCDDSDESGEEQDKIPDEETGSMVEGDEMDVVQGEDALGDVAKAEIQPQVEVGVDATDLTSVPHDPPLRKPNTRIRDAEAHLGTPELSPMQEAATRHHVQPLVSRRHARRIKKAQDGDFFGTPSPILSDAELEGKDLESPTADAEARHHAQDYASGRQPTRLDEGAFNKAFSDTKGRSRIGSSGKSRRRSGVDFEDGVDFIGEEDPNEEHATVLPQWPPVRMKGSSVKIRARPPAPSTPIPMGVRKSKDHEHTVTTKIVSVQTVRTVARRVDRRPKATPFPRGSLLTANEVDDDDDLADEPESSPSPPQTEARAFHPDPSGTSVVVDGGVGRGTRRSWLESSQHHPFSQVPHPFSQQAVPSPTRLPLKQDRVPLSKPDVSRLQRLLLPQQPAAGPSETSANFKLSTEGRRPKAVPLSDKDRVRLDSLSRMEGQHGFPEPIKRPKSSPDRNPETPFDGPQSTPLTNEGNLQPGTARHADYITMPEASGSRNRPLLSALSHVDKGKGRADESPTDAHARRHTVNGYDHLFYQPQRRVNVSAFKQPVARQSLPSVFGTGDNEQQTIRSALSLVLHPSNRYSYPSSIASTAMLSRSVSPTKSANTSSLADTLPPNEFEMIKDLGWNTALHIMARNHGFNEDIVRTVYLNAGSLEATDNILREMREAANDTASEALSRYLSDQDDEDDASAEAAEEGHTGEEAEVLRHLTQEPKWPQDAQDFSIANEPPLAESSRISVSHLPSSRKRQSLVIQRLSGEQDATAAPGYSPPKHTRAARYLKHTRESIGQSNRGSTGCPATRRPVPSSSSMPKAPETEGILEFNELVRLDREGWRKLEESHGKGSAKILTGKALARLLQRQ
ncbi:hypothetical protein BC628DRAFT_1503996 [Trametes gibbosa]|nr:hypothetical protein BC628DRAFT_1503996 [Trametes gibbosa]